MHFDDEGQWNFEDSRELLHCTCGLEHEDVFNELETRLGKQADATMFMNSSIAGLIFISSSSVLGAAERSVESQDIADKPSVPRNKL